MSGFIKKHFRKSGDCTVNKDVCTDPAETVENERCLDISCADGYESKQEPYERSIIKTKEHLKPLVEHLLADVDEKVKKTGTFICASEVRFAISQDKDGLLEIVCFHQDIPEGWYLILHVLQKEEYGYNEYIKTGTNLQEIRSFLLSDEGLHEILESMMDLSDSVDERSVGMGGDTHPTREKKSGTCSRPELSSYYHVEGQELIFTSADRKIVKPILDEYGSMIDFPGIAPWVEQMLGRSPGINAGIYGSNFDRYGDEGFILYWRVQPDGRYWEDEDGFGMTNDQEIVLFSILDKDGCFTSPFRLYEKGNLKYYYGVDDCEPRPLFAYKTRSTTWGRGELELSVARCGNIYGELTIPERIGSFRITEISMIAFLYCTGLRKINLPDSIDTIESQAFDGCTRLKYVQMPNRMKYANIEFRTFSNCISLSSIKIPDGVKGIGAAAFQGCRSLKTVSLPDGMCDYGNACFNGCSQLSQITLPAGIGLFLPSSFGNSPLFQHISEIRSCAASERAFNLEESQPNSQSKFSIIKLAQKRKLHGGAYVIGKGFILKRSPDLLCETEDYDNGSYVITNRASGERTKIMEIPYYEVDGTDEQISARLCYRAKHIGLFYPQDNHEKKCINGIVYTICKVKLDGSLEEAVIAVSHGYSLLIIGEVDFVSKRLMPYDG